MIETLEKVLSGSGKLYIVDSNAGTTQLLTLNDVTDTEVKAAAAEGGK